MDLKGALRELQSKRPVSRSAADEPRAPLVELFHSIQGEGRFVGTPTTFVRLATCPLRCLYCDTPDSYVAPSTAPVRFGVRTQQEPNPVSAARAAELVRQLRSAVSAGAMPGRVSVTGGEPLVFPDWLARFGQHVREGGARLHLETAGLDPEALQRCVQQVDHLSCDFKLPETLGQPQQATLQLAPGEDYGERHVRCCEIALRRGASVDVKIVLTDAVVDPSFERALERLVPLRDKLLLVLQPVTPFGAVRRALSRAALERHLATAVRAGFEVRVLAQMHKQLSLP